MKINSLEEIKDVNLYIVKAENWYVLNTTDYYIQLIVQGLDFSNVDIDDFSDFSDEIIGMSYNDFSDWLVDKSEDEGYFLDDYLENEFSVYPDDYVVEEMYADKNKEPLSIEETSKLFDNDNFELANSQPIIDNECFTSVDEANNYLKKEFPFHKID